VVAGKKILRARIRKPQARAVTLPNSRDERNAISRVLQSVKKVYHASVIV